MAAPRLVILESPFAGDVARNTAYARACLRDSVLRGEAPIASHLLYTQPGVLDDANPNEREQGIRAGLAWLQGAVASVVYTDRGITPGMDRGIEAARLAGVPVEYRTLTQAEVFGLAMQGAIDRRVTGGAFSAQVGGDHYKKMKIQPMQYILANGLNFVEGCVVKYVSRWRSKNGLEDLRKARHNLDLLIEHAEKDGAA